MGEYRFVTNWHAVREHRISLVQKVRDGDQEAMGTLRAMALRAGVFSGLSINTAVWRQEEQFAGWLEGKPIVGLPGHQCVERIGAWIAASMTLDILADTSGVAFAASAATIKYLGTAKSHFFAACMGYDLVPCVDVHMSRLLKERGIMRQKSAPQSFVQYRKLVQASGWRTLDQWEAFLAVPPQFANKPCFADTNHDIFFRAMLGDKAVCA